jgi:hypothetical protein
MCPDWFGQHGSQRDKLKRCWWRSMQLKRGELKEGRNSWTDCINGSPALCSMTECFSKRYITGELYAVDREYRFINRSIAGIMNLLAWYIIFSHVRVNCARLLRRSALPQGWVSIRQKNSRSSPIRRKSIVESSRCWMENTLNWA